MIAFKQNYFSLLGVSFFINLLLLSDALSSSSLTASEFDQEHLNLFNSSPAQNDAFFQPTYEYFKKKIEAGCLPLAAHDIKLLQNLPLAQWQFYFQEFDETFMIMCLFKASHDKKWTLPQSIKDSIIEHATKKKRIGAQYALGLMYDLGVSEAQNDIAAFCWYKYAADRGHAGAENAIGDFYAQGQGVEQNKIQAQFWYTRAARKGYAIACFNLGILSYHGEGGVPDYTHSFYWFKLAAEKGLAKAQYNLAVLFYYGIGCHPDEHQAVFWYKRAAAQGLVEAQFELGYLRYEGPSHLLDNEEAFYYLKLAAEQNHLNANYHLGLLYLYGRGIPQDCPQALNCFLKAAQRGHLQSQYQIGLMHEEGKGILQDYSQAFTWYMLAANKNYKEAQHRLGILYAEGKGVTQDYSQAFYWFMSSALQDYAPACYCLGLIYHQGLGVSIDYNQAVYWYTFAADKGHVEAQYNLALVYANPNNPFQDYFQAFYWHLQAAHQGHMRACNNVGMCFHKGLGVPKDEAQALYWYTIAAEKGYSRAQRNLALIYLNEAGKHLNYDQGIRWLLIAAKNRYAPAQEMLKGLLHLKKKMQTFKQEDDSLSPHAHFEDFYTSCETLKQTIEKMYLKHKEELQANELERAFSIPFLHHHYCNLVNLEEKALSIINLLTTKAYFIDSIDLEKRFYSGYSQRREHYYQNYIFQGKSYLCLGKDAVEDGDKLTPFLKGQDKVYEAALVSISILKEIYKNKDKTCLGRALNLQQLLRQGKAIDQAEFTRLLENIKKTGVLIKHHEGESFFFKSGQEKEQCLQEIEELRNLPKQLTHLFIQGTRHRNALFMEEYPFLF